MKKKFDCIAMKRACQTEIYARTKDMNRQEEIAFFQEGAEDFRRQAHRARNSLPCRAASSANPPGR